MVDTNRESPTVTHAAQLLVGHTPSGPGADSPVNPATSLAMGPSPSHCPSLCLSLPVCGWGARGAHPGVMV